jgi:acyl dehydratase
MAAHFEITDAMRAEIGRELPPWTYEITRTSVRAFARGVGTTDPVYFDVEAARRAGYRDLPAPPSYLGTPIFLPGISSDTFSWPSASQPRVEHGLPGLLDGGTEIEYLDQICAGDTLVAVARLTDLQTRENKTLGTMLITTSETVFTNAASGRVVARLRGQAIFY